MTGPEHFKEAERILACARSQADESYVDDLVAAAQVHATLALAAAAALRAGDGLPGKDYEAWYDIAGVGQHGPGPAAVRREPS